MTIIYQSIFVFALTTLSVVHNIVLADATGFQFTPIDSSASSSNWKAAAPWKLPDGFTQTVVANEQTFNLYANHNDWHDMITVNETGAMAGRFLYRTHEIYKHPQGGAVSVVDLKTGATKILAQDPAWNAVDGIEWTPWGSILINEEINNGCVFEIILDPDNPLHVVQIVARPQLGLLAHEGIQVGPDGAVYVVDEFRGLTSRCDGVAPCGGGIYKFVPNKAADLSAGNLYVLKVDGDNGTGKAEWVGPIDPMHARIAGSKAGGSSYQRPEDLQFIGNILYVAITEGTADAAGKNYAGRVIAIDLDNMRVSDFVKPGLNVPIEIGKPGAQNYQTGFANPDNLAVSADGRLIIIEDNVPSDIWFASTQVNAAGVSKQVHLFASLTDPKAEGTGIYFSPFDANTLYVNIQHSRVKEGDATWAISKNTQR